MYKINVNDYPEISRKFRKTIIWNSTDGRLISLVEYAATVNEYLNPYEAWITDTNIDIIKFKTEADRTLFLLKFS